MQIRKNINFKTKNKKINLKTQKGCQKHVFQVELFQSFTVDPEITIRRCIISSSTFSCAFVSLDHLYFLFYLLGLVVSISILSLQHTESEILSCPEDYIEGK